MINTYYANSRRNLKKYNDKKHLVNARINFKHIICIHKQQRYSQPQHTK